MKGRRVTLGQFYSDERKPGDYCGPIRVEDGPEEAAEEAAEEMEAEWDAAEERWRELEEAEQRRQDARDAEFDAELRAWHDDPWLP